MLRNWAIAFTLGGSLGVRFSTSASRSLCYKEVASPFEKLLARRGLITLAPHLSLGMITERILRDDFRQQTTWNRVHALALLFKTFCVS